jgi:hypothetical protein
MQPRFLLLLLLQPCFALAHKNPTDSLTKYDFYLRRHYDNLRTNAGIGLSGGSLNFHQNGNLGLNMYYTYNLVQLGRSSISITQGLTFGSEDEYGVSFPILAAVALFAGPSDQNLNLNHIVAVYADFPLLLHYNFGAGARRDTEGSDNEKLGFYIGGGATHTFTGYTNTFGKEAQTDYWALVADGGIRFKSPGAAAWTIGFAVERPLRSPIGPIRNPLFFQLNWSTFIKF